ncbi:hypothetical protein OsI_25967 [Oryza sativa Indica Group]|uniref:Uncharacterized protein n=1 Tax=Oryza sativa subsp. indica TaxID=39946 RepID=B8B5Z5_ORYSI|nr:hypothetical protein OsI_25967 [Oryza sativa Indica Group]
MARLAAEDPLVRDEAILDDDDDDVDTDEEESESEDDSGEEFHAEPSKKAVYNKEGHPGEARGHCVAGECGLEAQAHYRT